MGRQFALQLAGYGYNVMLLSRTQAKLTALAVEIGALPYTCSLPLAPSSVTSVTHRICIKESKYGVQTRSCEIDYALRNNIGGYAAVEGTLSGIPIGILGENRSVLHL